jgi:hypothetical protein
VGVFRQEGVQEEVFDRVVVQGDVLQEVVEGHVMHLEEAVDSRLGEEVSVLKEEPVAFPLVVEAVSEQVAQGAFHLAGVAVQI